MGAFPDDIFTEQEDVDPDTLANLGPLRRLAGIWEGRKGADVAPKSEGPERRQFFERIEMCPIDPQANGPQLFYGLRYHIHINTPEEAITFHDQVGYWLYEKQTGLILQTLTIPRGQVAIASGHATPGDHRLLVKATRGETEYGICSTAFLEHAFRTDSYQLEVIFNLDGSWSYVSDTTLTVHGQDKPFLHRDRNTLTKVAEPTPNPLALLAARGKVWDSVRSADSYFGAMTSLQAMGAAPISARPTHRTTGNRRWPEQWASNRIGRRGRCASPWVIRLTPAPGSLVGTIPDGRQPDLRKAGNGVCGVHNVALLGALEI